MYGVASGAFGNFQEGSQLPPDAKRSSSDKVEGDPDEPSQEASLEPLGSVGKLVGKEQHDHDHDTGHGHQKADNARQEAFLRPWCRPQKGKQGMASQEDHQETLNLGTIFGIFKK
jgi:hypothetical protein